MNMEKAEYIDITIPMIIAIDPKAINITGIVNPNNVMDRVITVINKDISIEYKIHLIKVLPFIIIFAHPIYSSS